MSPAVQDDFEPLDPKKKPADDFVPDDLQADQAGPTNSPVSPIPPPAIKTPQQTGAEFASKLPSPDSTFVNPRTGVQAKRNEMGTGLGPERLLDTTPTGLAQAGGGVSKLTSPQSTLDDRLRGISEIGRGVAHASTPFVLPMLAAAAPGMTAGGVLGGIGRLGAGALAQTGTEKLLTPKDQQPTGAAQLAGDVMGGLTSMAPFGKLKKLNPWTVADNPDQRILLSRLGLRKEPGEATQVIGDIQKTAKAPIKTAEQLYKAADETAGNLSRTYVDPYFDRARADGVTIKGEDIAKAMIDDLPKGMKSARPKEYADAVQAITAEYANRVITADEAREANTFFNQAGAAFYKMVKEGQLTADAAQRATATLAAEAKAFRSVLYPALDSSLGAEGIRSAQRAVGDAIELKNHLEPMLTRAVAELPATAFEALTQKLSKPIHLVFAKLAGPVYKVASTADYLAAGPKNINGLVEKIMAKPAQGSKLGQPYADPTTPFGGTPPHGFAEEPQARWERLTGLNLNAPIVKGQPNIPPTNAGPFSPLPKPGEMPMGQPSPFSFTPPPTDAEKTRALMLKQKWGL